MHLSIIIPSSRPTTLAHVVRDLNEQSADGLDYEIVIVQESDDGFDKFTHITYSPRFKILRQRIHHDCGATARDIGFNESSGKYVAFWDDDNIYYKHAATTIYSVAYGHPFGVTRVKHRGLVIPTFKGLKPGDVDSMCFCVQRELAAQVKWADHGGRYNDFRWITKIASITNQLPNFSPVIVGEHV